MIREIVKDPKVLTQVSEDFNPYTDYNLIEDMLDTARAHINNCAGLACIQIGVPKRLILVRKPEGDFEVFRNPAIVKRSKQTYVAQEGCLSLEGTREVKRYLSVMVTWIDQRGKRKTKEFTGRTAQVLQHEIDHTRGVLI